MLPLFLRPPRQRPPSLQAPTTAATRNANMADPIARRTSPRRNGGTTRRELLRAGLAGFGALSLPGLLRLRAEASTPGAGEPTAVILVWLRGGCSHLDTYDPKPDAPAEYRGPFAPLATRTPGLSLTE